MAMVASPSSFALLTRHERARQIAFAVSLFTRAVSFWPRLRFMGMSYFYTTLGGMFLALALFFLMGLLNPFARRFYPGKANVVARSAAPVIFACLAMACFKGAGLQALLALAVAGVIQITLNHRKRDRQKIRA